MIANNVSIQTRNCFLTTSSRAFQLKKKSFTVFISAVTLLILAVVNTTKGWFIFFHKEIGVNFTLFIRKREKETKKVNSHRFKGKWSEKLFFK